MNSCFPLDKVILCDVLPATPCSIAHPLWAASPMLRTAGTHPTAQPCSDTSLPGVGAWRPPHPTRQPSTPTCRAPGVAVIPHYCRDERPRRASQPRPRGSHAAPAPPRAAIISRDLCAGRGLLTKLCGQSEVPGVGDVGTLRGRRGDIAGPALMPGTQQGARRREGWCRAGEVLLTHKHGVIQFAEAHQSQELSKRLKGQKRFCG